MAVTAMFLAMTQWFGRSHELQEVAQRLDLRVILPEGFEHSAQTTGFEFSRFSAMLRKRLFQHA